MKRFTNSLDNVRVASPCSAEWDEMFGDERVRFCGKCELNVFNLSAMSRRDAESLIARTEGRLCVRFYRRKDGSILTEDCPIGLRALKQRASRIRKAVASTVLGFLATIGVHFAMSWFGGWFPEPRPLTGVMVAPGYPNPAYLPEPPSESHLMGKAIISHPTRRCPR